MSSRSAAVAPGARPSRLPLASFLGFVLFSQLLTGFYAAHGWESPRELRWVESMGYALGMSLWFLYERQRHPRWHRYSGLVWLALWPLIVPAYLVRTRGWGRTLLAALSFLVISMAGYLLGLLLPRVG